MVPVVLHRFWEQVWDCGKYRSEEYHPFLLHPPGRVSAAPPPTPPSMAAEPKSIENLKFQRLGPWP